MDDWKMVGMYCIMWWWSSDKNGILCGKFQRYEGYGCGKSES